MQPLLTPLLPCPTPRLQDFILDVALELTAGLSHLHSKNIIHGDLNPNNALLKSNSRCKKGFVCKLAVSHIFSPSSPSLKSHSASHVLRCWHMHHTITTSLSSCMPPCRISASR